MVSPPLLGLAVRNINHCDQRNWRPGEPCARRNIEGLDRSRDCRAPAYLYEPTKGTELLSKKLTQPWTLSGMRRRLTAQPYARTDISSSTNSLSASSVPASSNEFVTAARPAST